MEKQKRSTWSFTDSESHQGHEAIRRIEKQKQRGTGTMLKACSICGRVHDRRLQCRPIQSKYSTNESQASHIRGSSHWKKLRAYIRGRDNNVCQLCLRNFPGTIRPYETDGLEVHHITKIEEDESKAFDEDNLISLCRVHHEMAEQGRVAAKDLVAIAKENNERYR